mmetsp:Transcript_9834/g.14397  ORF Transcript_9834/g.14397 Transcript_9834/m.14397 type:complete len:153 (+) Transcript_9834:54-512(+)|eukprot:CAMPEP_0195517114 /NCGR_PEP_ID=MMETSP0794_2-20130614/9810_1 /TAXON_ID=515487 /ORGANISM="Stephanopyxis turris, Strain CCMP 815" /LENGTH=152 /DNA_ID=CAMNT_0040645869 /DNA_START=39 /DNA_END=497 /DNA_ORIENTATION=-
MLRAFATSALRIRPTFASQSIAPTRFAGIRAFSEIPPSDGDIIEGKKIAGTVKWFDPKKGFGFLVPSDGSDDVFVHHSSVYAKGFRSLAEGEEVEFEVTIDEQGRRNAQDVTGPYGAFVQGAPRQFDNFDNDRGFDNNRGYGNDNWDYRNRE